MVPIPLSHSFQPINEETCRQANYSTHWFLTSENVHFECTLALSDKQMHNHNIDK
jgi:hypothetical protein